MSRSREKPKYQIKIAKERIAILFKEARDVKDPELAKRYMKLAKTIGMRYNVRLGKLKHKFCKKCYTFFTSGTCHRRLKKGILVVKCLECGNITRYPYKSKRKK